MMPDRSGLDVFDTGEIADPPPPHWARIGGRCFPRAPTSLTETGVDPVELGELALRIACASPQFSTDWVAQRIQLPRPLVGEILEQHRADLLLEPLGEAGPFGFRYALSRRGRERAERLLEATGYAGPAPVSLPAYAESVAWQVARLPEVTPARVAKALAGLELAGEVARTAGLAASSGRSLFLHGPPGNGKSTLGRMLHEALGGDLWIPHCLAVEGGVIRLFDPQCHEPAEDQAEPYRGVDRRWVRIRRPLIVAGGEMTIESLDLTYDTVSKRYEAPLHLKANGGTLLIDDFGRQRVDPIRLLNRWIIPLEHKADYLTLRTGQKLLVPLAQRLIIATNLAPEDVTDPAFLRRMGYRLYLGRPSPGDYARIFERQAARSGIAVEPGLVDRLLDRYRREGRELRGCEPRDLVERALDICRYEGRPPMMDDRVLGSAWAGYFGNGPSEIPG
jgi:hypothetical protein